MNTINLKAIKEMETINLSVQTVQAILNYLAVQPYKDVAVLIANLQSDINAQPSKEEDIEESK
ncbi:hypothetical protein [Parabacteroides goldsteinii]|uniref:hypothetical protein n=1 Tax=Parabacteroides goldsteinii TaxID=328812 RepID=UPI00216658A9|nr:hypothetical protein [Parabacteroides goldsteinii]MCS2426133.1 hypothetical protein [Parabacteroides goldsteinii]